MQTLLSTTYFGPIQWYQKLNRSEWCLIEAWESFQKQTFRNRCLIATTNGMQALTVPVERGDSRLIRDTRISDHNNWRHLHWHALLSAYGESPFFEFYADDLRPFFEKRWTYLLDFNMEITTKMCELIDIEPHIARTETFVLMDEKRDKSTEPPSPIKDFREAIQPKHPLPDPDFTLRHYYQVYQQKHGFLPNLSILDLLFNEGPEAVLYL